MVDNVTYPQPPPLFAGNNLLGTAQGMFGGLRRGFRAGGQALHPYSNRLMLAGLGMLGGGPSDAMKGLVAGSALDTEDADRRKLNAAIQELMNDPEGSLSDISPAEKRFLGAAGPEVMGSVLGARLKPSTNTWQRLSDDTVFNDLTGETKRIGGGGAGSFLKGNAAETQALRYLVETGQLTEDQAAQWAAGKTITGPNGEILFISPDQILNAAGMDGKNGGDGPQQITGGKMTEEQRKAKGFYERASAADALIGDPAISQGAWDRSASSVLPEGVAPYVTSESSQQFRQARDDFINANLRRESGAAISPKEYADADRIFFPQPGEPDAVLKQKAAARRRVVQALQESWQPASISPADEESSPTLEDLNKMYGVD